jgi:light-regulated signal transduction histidine kinase (bacteriophytochrome)
MNLTKDPPIISGPVVIGNVELDRQHHRGDEPDERRAMQIGTESDSDSVWVAVRDSGPGLAPANLALTFEPFLLHDQVQRFKEISLDGRVVGRLKEVSQID